MESDSQTQAAVKIQRLWRSRRAKPLDTAARWQDATDRVQLKVEAESAIRGDNSPRSRWRRAAVIARRIKDPNVVLTRNARGQQISAESNQYKILETQHWLELIDGKHRYGSNLKRYHSRWLSETTKDNFFRWLDHGAGRGVSLPECPRERLESESFAAHFVGENPLFRWIYIETEANEDTFLLSKVGFNIIKSTEPDIRPGLNYLVKIDKEGKLRWARNDQLVDTTPGKWKDLGNGVGIGPVESTSQITIIPTKQGTSENLAHHYTSHKKRSRISRAIRYNFTPTGIMDRLLQKTVKQNTWIYVTDKNYNLFIGIKATGTFQHSSFLSGGLVTSAGLISVESGVIRKLSPLSGHYRTSIEHFKNMVKVLNEQGAHLGKLDINKAEVILWGASRYAKVKGLGKSAKSVLFPKQVIRGSGRRGGPENKHEKKTFAIREKRRNILYGHQ